MTTPEGDAGDPNVTIQVSDESICVQDNQFGTICVDLDSEQRLVFVRQLLPGAAIVADPAGVLSLINDYVAMVLSHNEGGRIMRWKQIRTALGIKGVVR